MNVSLAAMFYRGKLLIPEWTVSREIEKIRNSNQETLTLFETAQDCSSDRPERKQINFHTLSHGTQKGLQLVGGRMDLRIFRK